jgi:hypothetical protein
MLHFWIPDRACLTARWSGMTTVAASTVGRNSEAYCAGYANLERDVEWEMK